jgi:hypothetical protein
VGEHRKGKKGDLSVKGTFGAFYRRGDGRDAKGISSHGPIEGLTRSLNLSRAQRLPLSGCKSLRFTSRNPCGRWISFGTALTYRLRWAPRCPALGRRMYLPEGGTRGLGGRRQGAIKPPESGPKPGPILAMWEKPLKKHRTWRQTLRSGIFYGTLMRSGPERRTTA